MTLLLLLLLLLSFDIEIRWNYSTTWPNCNNSNLPQLQLMLRVAAKRFPIDWIRFNGAGLGLIASGCSRRDIRAQHPLKYRCPSRRKSSEKAAKIRRFARVFGGGVKFEIEGRTEIEFDLFWWGKLEVKGGEKVEFTNFQFTGSNGHFQVKSAQSFFTQFWIFISKLSWGDIKQQH